jgi:2-keto-4-pentenoate hydratase/2-oxohepta-3-ene-1,7-dioic acid hydratase in catechol pathway
VTTTHTFTCAACGAEAATVPTQRRRNCRHHEAAPGVVIGREGHRIREANATYQVFGYTRRVRVRLIRYHR